VTHLPIAVSTLDLARIQFGMTSIYHFLFVPLTLGLAPLVAVMQTLWHRKQDQHWLRLTRFFGTLMLINIAIAVATGLVQEFQFGMNWSVYSKYVGNVFGAPLAIEGLAAFFLESVFLGLWIFGWNRLSPRLHLATIWLVALGAWLSAYFILVANSWMQHPVGYKVSGGKAELTSIGDLLTNEFALRAYLHVLLAGLITGSLVIFGVACWHILRRRNIELFQKAAALALIVAVPASLLQLSVGNRFGETVTSAQGMKIASTEALWNTQQPASFSIFQIGGFTKQDQNPSVDIEIPRLLSFLATGSFNGKVQGINQLQAQEAKQYGSGNYIPSIRTLYIAMRVMAYLGTLFFLVAALGAWLYRRGKLETTRWFLWTGVVVMFLPFVASIAGWVLTEMGRQPWIVQNLLKTQQAHSPSVDSASIITSICVFASLYIALGITDFVLMRRYARIDPPEEGEEEEPPGLLAMGY
jgi:cytochrome bd ubiquinol oxidase subunit I